MKPEKTNPPQVASFGGPSTCEGPDESGKLPDRVQRYGKARNRARQMVQHLQQVQQVSHPDERRRKAVVRLADCGEYLCFHHYYTVGKVRLTMASFCKQHLICPLCAIRRGAKSLKAYLDRFEVIRAEQPVLKPYMVTFTVKNGDDLAERFDHLHESLKVLHRRRRQWFTKGRGWTEAAKAAGAVWSYELTNTGKGWHPHVHAIWLCEEAPNQASLRAEWERITGDSFMVDVRPIQQDDPAEGFSEVFKYAVKFAGLSLQHNVEAWETLRGRRMLGSFGAFRGVEVPEELTDEPLDGLPYVELFYRYAEGAGYTLKHAHKRLGSREGASEPPRERTVREPSGSTNGPPGLSCNPPPTSPPSGAPQSGGEADP